MRTNKSLQKSNPTRSPFNFLLLTFYLRRFSFFLFPRPSGAGSFNLKSPFSFSLFPFNFLLLFLLTFSFFLLGGCSKNGTESNDNTITVSGKVTLEGQSDHSGVTVRLYKPVTLDTALVRINQQYPNIGVKISQETEFDHREQTASYSTTTNANGDWSIEKVEKGNYNVVIIKEDYGEKYFLDYSLQDNRTIPETGLNRIIILNQGQYNNYNFQSGVHYRITSNSIFTNPTIPSNIVFLLEGQMIIDGLANNDHTVRGNKFLGENNAARIQFEGMNSISIENGIFKKILNGVRFVNIQSVHLNNTTIQEANDLLYCNQIQNLSINQCLFANSSRGIEILGSNTLLSSSIVTNVVEGIKIYDSVPIINNNYLSSGNFGIVVYIDNQIEIKHNIFDNFSVCALALFACHAEVSYNIFTGNSSWFISINSEYLQQSFQQPDVHLEKNNFMGPIENVAVHLLYNTSLPGDIGVCAANVNAENNFWNTNSEIFISNRILDRNETIHAGEVFFLPFLISPADSAGLISN